MVPKILVIEANSAQLTHYKTARLAKHSGSLFLMSYVREVGVGFVSIAFIGDAQIRTLGQQVAMSRKLYGC
jgi:hypothetical protein